MSLPLLMSRNFRAQVPPETTAPDKRGLTFVEFYESGYYGEGCYKYSKLNNLTGRWRLTPHSSSHGWRMQVERKGRFFKHWIDESMILYKVDPDIAAVFDCHSN